MSLLHKEDALGKNVATHARGRGQRRNICCKVSGAVTLAASVALAGSAALAQDLDEVPVVSPNATLEDVQIAAMLHTPLTVDEIDAAVAEGVRKGEELARQLDAEELANTRLRTKPMLAPQPGLPAAWACAVQLTACIASGDGRYTRRERLCNNDLKVELVGCRDAEDGGTEARLKFDQCRDVAKLMRDACIAGSESKRGFEIVACRSTYNCDPLPSADAMRRTADCGGG